MMDRPRDFFAALFNEAVTAADPARAMAGLLPPRPKGRVIVIGAGKASAQMAAALESLWDGPLEGLVVTRYGFAVPCKQIRIVEAAHPVPDAAGSQAADQIFDLLQGLTADDLVIALISGGGSALLPAPPEGMDLADEIAVNQVLLASGAPISAMNTVRKHLSRIKGGRLALAAYPAKMVSFIVSDIPGDNPAFVASGPTVADWPDRKAAQEIVRSWSLDLPPAALRHLETSVADAPMPDDPRFGGHQVHIVASAGLSLEAAAAFAEKQGVETHILSDSIEGEARDVGQVHAAIAREIAAKDRPFRKPVLLLSGGETTVTLRGKNGKGGRNTEFLLGFALAVQGIGGIHAFAADTDGIDGSENNAGAFADAESVTRMRAAGQDPADALSRNDAFTAFSAAGDLFSPGPTGTNVNDFRAILITDAF